MYKDVNKPWRFSLLSHRPRNGQTAAVLTLLALAFWPQKAEATGANFLSFKQAYPSAKGVSCKTCHQGAIGKKGDLNAYGTALQKLKLPKDAKSLKAADFHAMDDKDSAFQIEAEIKYEGYIVRQKEEVERFKRLEDKKIPSWVDFENIKTLKTEARKKLTEVRPVSLGQASRIAGVTPADISILMVWLEKGKYPSN